MWLQIQIIPLKEPPHPSQIIYNKYEVQPLQKSQKCKKIFIYILSHLLYMLNTDRPIIGPYNHC